MTRRGAIRFAGHRSGEQGLALRPPTDRGRVRQQQQAEGPARDEKLEIGDREYDATLNASLAFERFAPYLGIGWTSGRSGAGVGFSVDAGAFYHGSPDLSATGSAGGCSFSVSKGATATVGDGCVLAGLEAQLKTDLEKEHRKLRKDLDLNWYPVLSVGVSYRF